MTVSILIAKQPHGPCCTERSGVAIPQPELMTLRFIPRLPSMSLTDSSFNSDVINISGGAAL